MGPFSFSWNSGKLTENVRTFSMDFESIIRQHVFLGRSNAKGWCPVLCRVCNDHGQKGARAGFRFEPGSFGYNCFNCGKAGGFSDTSVEGPTEDTELICSAFGIPDDFVNDMRMLAINNRTNGNAVSQQILAKSKTSAPKVLEVPDYFVSIADLPADYPLRIVAEDHLSEERSMTPGDYPFYVALPKKNDPESKRWAYRLIIPIFNHADQVIYWQARDLTGLAKRKYLNVDVERDNILYGMHELYNRTNAPLFITEGFFDAWHVKGVATLGRTLTPAVIEMLQNCPREKIVIPDRLGNGAELAEAALKQGWKVSVPDFGQCKDVTEAVVKYGKLFVIKSIMDNIYSGTAAETMIGLHCK